MEEGEGGIFLKWESESIAIIEENTKKQSPANVKKIESWIKATNIILNLQ